MNVLVTAGNTLTPIDRVRAITNVFSGRTGEVIANEARFWGHDATLLTSRLDADTGGGPVEHYRTFDELHGLMARHLTGGHFDTLVHTAAVSDFRPVGVYAPAPGSSFDAQSLRWSADAQLVDRAAGKVKSSEPELWLRLERAPKLIDMVRDPWGFRGVVVKFKLEVGVTDDELLTIAEASRVHSGADLIVANTLEGAAQWAHLGPLDGRYEKLRRDLLPLRLVEALGQLHAARAGRG